MRRRLLIPLLLLLALFGGAPGVGAQSEGTGTISGTVSGPDEGGPPPGLEVELLFLPDGQGPPQITRQPLGADGTFLFDNVDPSPNHRYLVRVTLEGEENFSDLIAFPPGENQQQVSLRLLARTTDASALSLPSTSAILDVRPEGWVVVILYRFVNGGERVIVNLTDPPVVIPLPAEATDLRFADDSFGPGLVELSDGFAYTGPFPPGELPFAFSYTLPYRAGTDDLVLPFLPAASPIRVLVPTIGSERTSENLRYVGEQEVSGVRFDEFEGAAGTIEARLHFEELPPPAAGTGIEPVRQPLVLPISPLERAPWWLPLLPVGVAVGALALYLWRREPVLPGERRATLRERRDRLVVDLAALESRFEEGQMGEQSYRRQRAALRGELRALLAREIDPAETD